MSSADSSGTESYLLGIKRHGESLIELADEMEKEARHWPPDQRSKLLESCTASAANLVRLKLMMAGVTETQRFHIARLIRQMYRFLGAIEHREVMNRLERRIQELIADIGQSNVASKQRLASTINDTIKGNGCELLCASVDKRHPLTDRPIMEPCILIGINDKYGGKFVFSERDSRKRSRSTRDINKLLPFTLRVQALHFDFEICSPK